MFNDKEFEENIEKLILDNSIEIPKITCSLEELAKDIIPNKEKFSLVLCAIAPFVSGRYITIKENIAKESVKHKKEGNLFVVNIALDLLKYINFIEYKKVSEEEIVIKIINEDFANEINNVRYRLIANKDIFSDVLIKNTKELMKDEQVETELKNRNLYEGIKEVLDDSTTTSK